MKLTGYGISDTGRVKQVNQDSLFYGISPNGDAGIFAVADGVGGLQFGEVASAKATENIEKWWQEFLVSGIGSDSEKTVDSLSALIFKINGEIYSFNETNQTKSATTLSLIIIYGDSYYIAHVGDSRVYAFVDEEKKIYQLTTDHSTDIVKERDGRKYIQSALTDGLGHRKSIKCDLSFGPLNDSVSAFLVCSDGIYKKQSDEVIAQIISAGAEEKQICENLIEGAKQAGESDNITAAFFRPDYQK